VGVNSYYECVLYLVRNPDQINCDVSNRLVSRREIVEPGMVGRKEKGMDINNQLVWWRTRI